MHGHQDRIRSSLAQDQGRHIFNVLFIRLFDGEDTKKIPTDHSKSKSSHLEF